MKKEYSSPEFDFLKIRFIKDALNVSDPDQGVNTGSGTGQNDPGVDPFDVGGEW